MGSTKPVLYGMSTLINKLNMPLETVIKMAALNPCRCYGLADTKGSIVFGKDADIAIFDHNPMEVFSKTLYTIIDGNIYFDYTKDSQEE